MDQVSIASPFFDVNGLENAEYTQPESGQGHRSGSVKLDALGVLPLESVSLRGVQDEHERARLPTDSEWVNEERMNKDGRTNVSDY